MAHALIFDSGVGGLSVAGEIRRLLPDLQQTYVADDEFRPYGEKSDEQLAARLPGLLWTLCSAVKPDVAVIACNTASTSALSEIRAALSIPVIGVVPAIKPAAGLSRVGRFAVLGTPGTVMRKYVDQLVEDFAPNHEVVLHGSTRLVAIAERKLSGYAVDLAEVKNEIAPLFLKGPIDVIVLACTHFPLLKAELTEVLSGDVTFIDSGQAIARRVQSVLQEIAETRPSRPGPDVALLIGPDAELKRKKAFQAFGFEAVIGLLP